MRGQTIEHCVMGVTFEPSVAIPALIFYRYLRGRVEGIVVEMEKQAIRMADALEAARGRERGVPGAVASSAPWPEDAARAGVAVNLK